MSELLQKMKRYVLLVFIFLFFMKTTKLVLFTIKVKTYQRNEKLQIKT
jgi:hypothetical protein